MRDNGLSNPSAAGSQGSKQFVEAEELSLPELLSQNIEYPESCEPSANNTQSENCDATEQSKENSADEPLPIWAMRAKSDDHLRRNLLLKRKIDFAKAAKEAKAEFDRSNFLLDTDFHRMRKTKHPLNEASNVLEALGDSILHIDPHARMLTEDIFSLPDEMRRPTLDRLVEMVEVYKVKESRSNEQPITTVDDIDNRDFW